MEFASQPAKANGIWSDGGVKAPAGGLHSAKLGGVSNTHKEFWRG